MSKPPSNCPIEFARPYTYETHPSSTFTLIANRHAGTIIGAWAMAPVAGEWIHTAALAIRHRLTADDLADRIAQYPTYTEALPLAADRLAKQLRA